MMAIFYFPKYAKDFLSSNLCETIIQSRDGKFAVLDQEIHLVFTNLPQVIIKVHSIQTVFQIFIFLEGIEFFQLYKNLLRTTFLVHETVYPLLKT